MNILELKGFSYTFHYNTEQGTIQTYQREHFKEKSDFFEILYMMTQIHTYNIFHSTS